jgi:UDP-N-acetyl-D-glucosamine dehydrogenase
MDTLVHKITAHSAHVSVIGLGYVGLPLAIEFARAGYRVTGIDTDPEKVTGINAGKSHIQDISHAELRQVVNRGQLLATNDFTVLSEVDTVSICVPTPLGKTKDPDISYICRHQGNLCAPAPTAVNRPRKYDLSRHHR